MMSTAFDVIEAFIDTLADSGVDTVCVSPGSRSTPLAVFAHRHPRITTYTVIDERSAAFFALGLTKARRRPVALVCTSGTAAANYVPAVAEAAYARIPLVVLTADRPPEARDIGSAQTIDQVGLFNSFVTWSVDMPVPETSPTMLRYFTTVAARAVAETTARGGGPVHVNMPFREPLMPPTRAHRERGLQARSPMPAFVGPSGSVPEPAELRALARELRRAVRGLIVCGPDVSGPTASSVSRLAAALDVPIVADPLSGLRFGSHDRSRVIDAYDTFLRGEFLHDHLAPDYILRFGGLPTSKSLTQFISKQPARHILVDPAGWRDATLTATDVIRAEPTALCHHLSAAVGEIAKVEEDEADIERPSANNEWLLQWRRLDDMTRRRLDEAMNCVETSGLEPSTKRTGTSHVAENTPEAMFEGRVFTELFPLLPDESLLFVGNSMPVRDLDAFVKASPKAVQVLANRGANGIDGVVSTALGAAVGARRPTAIVVGDLSFLHDLGGLLAGRACTTPVALIVVNNDGGGIFSFLPQAKEPEGFEDLFGTPHGLHFDHAAALFGLDYHRPASWSDFRSSIATALATPGVSVIEVLSNRANNLAMHRYIERQVLEALERHAH